MLWRFGLALILSATQAYSADLELLARRTFLSSHDRMGGLSGIEVLENGAHTLLLSDRGRIFETHDLQDLTADSIPVEFVGWMGGDSEGLAVKSPTEWFVSFEWPARVDKPWHACLPGHDDFTEMTENRALEALAIAEDGTLFALSERLMPDNKHFAIYRNLGYRWDIVDTLPASDRFHPVGADFGPDGLLYILERRFGLWGFSARIRRLAPGSGTPPETILRTTPGTFDNLEGLALWTDGQGRTRITMVSDNDFRSILRSEIVDFVLNE